MVGEVSSIGLRDGISLAVPRPIANVKQDGLSTATLFGQCHFRLAVRALTGLAPVLEGFLIDSPEIH